MTRAPSITELFVSAKAGNEEAVSALFALVYRELRRIAAGYVRGQRPGHTLTPTALVHEAYVRLVAGSTPRWADRVHFLAAVARTMRSALIDHERARHASKRGGRMTRVTLDEEMAPRPSDAAIDLIEFDQLLGKLTELDPRLGRLVELRAFGGLSVEETGQALGLSPTTVKREWRTAKAWLHRHLQAPAHG